MVDTSNRGERGVWAKKSLRGATDIRRSKPLAVAIIFAILLLLVITLVQRGQTVRSESYKEATGAAGLSASIDYDCRDSCEHKFDFNVSIFREDGQQVSVVRPDKDGNVNLALAEGNYVMLIGKQLGKDKLFPQEPLALKNGQMLELKLRYR